MAMRRFGGVVELLVLAVFNSGGNVRFGDPTGPQLVGHHHARLSPPLEEFVQEPRGSLPVPPGLDQNIKHIPPCINGAPESILLTSCLDGHLIKIPLVRRSWPTPPYLCREFRAKSVHPDPNGLTGHAHPALGHEILGIPQAEREAMTGPDRVGDNRRGVAKALDGRLVMDINHGVLIFQLYSPYAKTRNFS